MKEIGGVDIKYLAEKYGTPLYVYDFNRIEENVRKIKGAFRYDEGRVKIYYALKAFSHPVLIKFLKDRGLGFDCVSPGEIRLALECNADRKDIIFTGNYESYEDLEFAYKSKVLINLDDINSYLRLRKIGKVDFISFRINPGKGKGKYEQITTGGEKSKFGIPYEEAVEAYRIAYEDGIRRFGAHIMVGSGILDKDFFPSIVERFLAILKKIKEQIEIEFEHIDIGGGFGIPYFDDKSELDIGYTGSKVLKVFNEKVGEYRLGKPLLAIEPGRYIVGNAGYLITKVCGIKKSYRNFIGVDAGFNIFARPALYGAEHSVCVYNGFDKGKIIANICGQICENTDILARDRELPDLKEGDIIIFTNAGAYCSVLSSSYNMRYRPAEIAIYNSKDHLITRRETFEDYVSRFCNVELEGKNGKDEGTGGNA
ncbi:MAG: diaminopimelate decarboxylase [Candidatus Neomarinimicrobiota bacterium]|nr:MAG: diaminopimelate decarboxylase [Candidatus Neomarinimicrobiota bacterium]